MNITKKFLTVTRVYRCMYVYLYVRLYVENVKRIVNKYRNNKLVFCLKVYLNNLYFAQLMNKNLN